MEVVMSPLLTWNSHLRKLCLCFYGNVQAMCELFHDIRTMEEAHKFFKTF